MADRPLWAARLLAERMRRGWTQQQVAFRLRQIAGRELPNEQSMLRMLREWESGRRKPGIEYRQLFVRIYGLAEEEIFGVADGSISATNMEIFRNSISDEKLADRQFVASMTHISFGTEPLPPIDYLIRDIPRTPIPNKIGITEINHLNETISIFQRWDQRYGGGLSRDVVLATLRWSIDLLGTSCSSDIHRKLQSAVACLAHQSAWMAFDIGQQQAARRLFSVALQASVQAENWELRAHVLADMARQSVQLGQPDDALQLIRLAQAGSDEVSPLMRTVLHVVKAHAFGYQGNVQECLRQIGKAEDNFTLSTVDRPEWMNYFTNSQLHGDCGHALFFLSQRHKERSVDAISRLGLAVKTFEDTAARAKALCAGLQAIAAFNQNDVELGCLAAQETLRLAPTIRSTRLFDVLQSIQRATRCFHHKTEVQEVDRQICVLFPALGGP